jgi:tetratricopeptide (TPR) repeat protein
MGQIRGGIPARPAQTSQPGPDLSAFPRILSLWLAAAATLAAAEPADLAAARALLDARRFPEARSAFERLEAAEPSNPDVHYYVGELALNRGDTGTSVREMERAVQLAPSSALFRIGLGDAYGRSAEKAPIFTRFSLARKCVAEYQRASSLEPGNVDAHERLLEFYLRAPSFVGGDDDKAEHEASTVMKLDPARGARAYAMLQAHGQKVPPDPAR